MTKKFDDLVKGMSPEAQALAKAGTQIIVEKLADPIYLESDADANLIISQYRDGWKSYVILNQKQITAMVDTLLGPGKVKTITVDVDKLLAGKPQS